jgi:hypothetical protein
LKVLRSQYSSARNNIVVALASGAALFCISLQPARAANQQADDAGVAIDLHAYEAELQRYSEQIEQYKNQPAEIARLRNSLPSSWTVEADGTEFEVSTEPIESALLELQLRPANTVKMARDVEFRLAEMRQAAIEMGSGPAAAAPVSVAQSELHEIFQRREFRGIKGPSEWQLLENRFANWLTNWIGRLLSRLHISATTGNVLAWIVIGLAFAASSYWIFRTLSRRTVKDELPTSGAVEPSDSREWASEALAAAERGDYREAVHCAYWAAVARLEDLKLLRRDRSRTPRESLRLLDSHPDEQSSLRNLTGHFELIWYGYRAALPTDWSEAKILLEKFGCLAASTAPTANS